MSRNGVYEKRVEIDVPLWHPPKNAPVRSQITTPIASLDSLYSLLVPEHSNSHVDSEEGTSSKYVSHPFTNTHFFIPEFIP
jgi:hypothetical protein